MFEGGGMKGLAHIGALLACEQERIKILGVTGASAGAIVSALLCAGYKADELLASNAHATERGLFGGSLKSFFTLQDQNSLASLNSIKKHLSNPGIWSLVKIFSKKKNRRLYRKLKTEGGLLSMVDLRSQINSFLQAKLNMQKDREVVFADMPSNIPLKILAARVSGPADASSVMLFSALTTPEVSVAHAVCASAAIPLLFVPQEIDGSLYVDGGVISNFPAWSLEAERHSRGGDIPILGFRLVGRPTANKLPSLRRVAELSLFGDSSLESRNVRHLHEISLQTSANTLDFEMDYESRRTAVLEGKDCVERYFRTHQIIWPSINDRIERKLNQLRNDVMSAFEIPVSCRIRANVARPVEPDILKICHTANMNTSEDMDFELELRKGMGVAGQVWEKLSPIVSQIRDGVSKAHGLPPAVKRRIRKDLLTVLSIPIFNLRLVENGKSLADSFIGVLSFDFSENVATKIQDKIGGMPNPSKSGILQSNRSEIVEWSRSIYRSIAGEE